MLIKEGANVFTSDGQKVGEIERVVIDPASKEATHVVVRKRFLLTTDKMVSISLVGAAAGSARVRASGIKRRGCMDLDFPCELVRLAEAKIVRLAMDGLGGFPRVRGPNRVGDG